MVATIGISAAGELSVGNRRLVFEEPYFSDGTHTFYDIAPDGKSFLMFKAAEDLTQFLVVVNWDEELRRRAEVSAAK